MLQSSAVAESPAGILNRWKSTGTGQNWLLYATAMQTVLQQAVSKTGVVGYTRLEQLLENSDADLVVLATPSGLHSSQAVMIAAAGRHVMTEKPMATRWEDGLRMVRGL